MRVYRALAELPAPGPLRVGTVGNFDGVHRGHQELVRRVVGRARQQGGEAWAITFQPHPTKVLAPDAAPPLLATLEQRLELLAALGLDAALVLPFTREFAALSPREFVFDVICQQLAARVVYVGPNFRFGHRQTGDVAVLGELAREFGFEVQVVPPVVFRGRIVSSTVIRHLIAEGQVERAARLLARPFALTGRIQPGTGRGRKMGVPTLNLAHEQECLPARGVYITETLVGDKAYPSATNVGVRPTFDGQRLVVESHLLGFDETLTQGRLETRFYRRLRKERKFPSPDALREQIQDDLERTRQFFSRLEAAHARSRVRARS
ncbi:MAG: bifunctional riboflavin kinase/FAD synthetase [Acidobacteria bacterium]|nr:bifunctional riboflavin kinase/FAD synthetase [Acidobacteriota bacterium]